RGFGGSARSCRWPGGSSRGPDVGQAGEVDEAAEVAGDELRAVVAAFGVPLALAVPHEAVELGQPQLGVSHVARLRELLAHAIRKCLFGQPTHTFILILERSKADVLGVT